MKRLLSAIAFAAILSIAYGCSTEENLPPLPEPVDQNDIVFHAEVGAADVSSDRATVRVSHNGGDRETYCVFCYSDTEMSVESAILRKVAEITSSGDSFTSALTNGNNHVTIISGLDDNTEYRFVAFGLNSDGTTYGTPASAVFTTTKSPLEFSVSVSGITGNSAKVSVTSTGDDTDTWYYFLTEDVTSSLESLINNTVAGLSEGFELRSGNGEISLTGLTEGTEYRVVVTGLSPDKEISGTPGSAMFMTIPTFAEEVGWNVSYGGKKLEEEGKNAGYYYESLDVTAGATDRWFDITLDKASYMSELGGDPEKAIEYFIGYYNTLIESIGLDLQTGWSQLSYIGNTELVYDIMEDGDYVTIIAGVTINGNANGKYKALEFTADATAIDADGDYKAWLGGWRLENEEKTGFDISIVPYFNTVEARGYLMFGYEDTGSQFPVPLAAGENNTLQFLSNEEIGNVSFTDGSSGVLGFYGLSSSSSFYGDSGYVIAVATMDAGSNSANVTGGSLKSQSGSVQLIKMQYIAAVGGKYSLISDPSDIPEFPLTMKRADGTQVGTSAAGNGHVFSRAARQALSPSGAPSGVRTWSPVTKETVHAL